MKRIFLLTNIILFALSLHAQDASDYRPFIEEGKVWASYRYMPGDLIGHFVEYDYFDGDTVVAGKRCKLWIQEYVPRDGKGQTRRFSVPAYEENRKVWFFHEGDAEPRLAYDFGANPGDKLIVYPADALEFQYAREQYGLDFYNETLKDTLLILARGEDIVNDVKQEAIFFTSYKTDYMSAINSWDCHLIGVGSTILPTFTCSIGKNSSKRNLLYCIKGKEVLYSDIELAEEREVLLPTIVRDVTKGQEMLSSNHFDLTGRRLTSLPAKGIYIEGGKVRVAR